MYLNLYFLDTWGLKGVILNKCFTNILIRKNLRKYKIIKNFILANNQ